MRESLWLASMVALPASWYRISISGRAPSGSKGWEDLGYHMYGDPWREQRYAGD
jgi:DMSO/TMAO reductase YedYZ molybdopterin-dependent catalytic subunit